jgi:hypothetical protein
MTFDRQMIIQRQMLTTRSPLPTFLTIRKPTRDHRVKNAKNAIITLMSYYYDYLDYHRVKSIVRLC